MINVSTFLDEWSAQMAQTALESHGIESFIVKDDCGGMRPSLHMATGVRIDGEGGRRKESV